MWENRCKVAIVGAGFSEITRHGTTPLANLALDAVTEAVSDAGLQMSDIDGLATFAHLPASGHEIIDGVSIVTVNCMHTMLGDKMPKLRWTLQNETGNIGACVTYATMAVAEGVADYVVVWRAMHNPAGQYQNLPASRATGSEQFNAPYGFGPWGMAADYARYLEINNQNREKMATLAVQQRKYAYNTPHSWGQGKNLTREEYLTSRMVAYPFCLYDCDVPVQGAVAIVLARADAAKTLKQRPAYIAGFGMGVEFEVAGSVLGQQNYMTSNGGSGKQTWSMSGMSPKDVDVAQMYDGFAPSALYGLEGYGFTPRGTALDFIQNGTIEPHGQLPLNTFGGSLSSGRLHGLWHVIEGYKQAAGRSANQIKDVNVSFVGASQAQRISLLLVRDPY